MSATQLYPINPDRNTPWNALPNLPIDKTIYQTIPIYEQLGKTKEVLGLLVGRLLSIPNPTIFIHSIALQEAKNSSEIENIFTTDDELYQAYSDSDTADLIKPATKEVLKYREALWAGFSYLKKHNAFEIEYFHQLFEIIKQSKEGFRPDLAQTVIKQQGSGFNAGKVIYTPPRGAGIIQEKMENLISFLNSEEIEPNDLLLKMAIAHFQFEAIHPYRDGNGRIGRILMAHYFLQNNYLEFPVLYISRYIIENKTAYYEVLAGVSQCGDWESYLLYMLKAVEFTATKTIEKLNAILHMKELYVQRMDSMEIRKVNDLANAIFSQPYIKVSHLVKSKLFAENTARNYLNALAEKRLLNKIELKGRLYYINEELKEILAG